MTAEQLALLAKARQSLHATRVLRDEGLFEISIARAYYTMFYLVQSLLIGKGLTFSKHGATHSAFGLHFIKAGVVEPKFHRYLLDSFDLRITDDYEATTTLDLAQAEEQIAHAEEFLAMTETLLNT